MGDFWKTNRPYEIANIVTANHELSGDLVGHVYEQMRTRTDIQDEEKFFSRMAYQQWTWRNSKFNKLYRPVFTDEFNENHITEENIIHQDHFREYLYAYLDRETGDMREWYKRELVKMVLSGMTYREIQKATKINIRYITETVKQFKNDLFSDYYSSGDSTYTD